MSFEQTAFSFAVGHPPTPTRTPTSDNEDEQHGFQTPRLDTSSFDSRTGWDSNDPALNGSFQKTPKAQTKDLSTHAAHLLSTPNFALLSPQMPSPELPNIEAKTGSMESMIQTPPPTNSSGTKRKEKQNSTMRQQRTDGSSRHLLPKPASSGTETLSATSPPLPGPEQLQQQQQQFSFDLGSPGLFSGNNFGPATAPIFPQHKLFWDNNGPGMSMDFSADDLFGMPKQGAGLEPFVSSHEPATVDQTFIDFPGGMGDGNMNIGVTQGGMGDQMHQVGGAVDPSLLFSSPSSREATNLTNYMDDEALQPYAYQIQEARREKAYAGISKARRRRKPSVDSPAVVAALESLRDIDKKAASGGNNVRPGLRRSMTDSYMPRSGRSSSSSSRAGTSHGRSSPLKQVRADAKKRHRTSGRLVIDSDGRARLETVVHQGKPGSSGEMDVDSATYSSESESTEADEDEDGGYGALATSFGGDIGFGSTSRSGRFNSSASHSQKSSYSSYYSSNSEPGKSKTKPASKRASRHLILDPVKEGGSFEDDPTVSVGAAGQEVDSAQQALMHSMKASQRGRYSPQKQNVGLEPFVSSPSTVTETGWATPTSTENSRRSNFR